MGKDRVESSRDSVFCGLVLPVGKLERVMGGRENRFYKLHNESFEALHESGCQYYEAVIVVYGWVGGLW